MTTEPKTKTQEEIEKYVGFAVIVVIVFLVIPFFYKEVPESKFQRAFAELAPPDQVLFHTEIEEAARITRESDNSSTVKLAHINANENLCSNALFRQSQPHKGWVAIFIEANLSDSGKELDAVFEVGHGNKLYSDNVPQEIFSNIQKLEANQPVVISGSFMPGNMEQNQCFRKRGDLFGSSPNITSSKFIFNLSEISPLSLEELDYFEALSAMVKYHF